MNKDMLENIPQGLRDLPQWIVSNDDKIPYNPLANTMASVVSPITWSDFDAAVSREDFKNVGFVLTEEDEYVVIDLDDKPDNPAKPEDLAKFQEILKAANSYAELSVSGRGVHIILKGKLDKCVNTEHIEMYSDARYMICTGNTLENYDLPVIDGQHLIDKLVKDLKPANNKAAAKLVSIPQKELDETILNRAYKAENGDKFEHLFKGNWRQLGFKSQSEADLALMSMLAFYSESNDQCERLFLKSELGQRKKSRRDDYIYRTLSRARVSLQKAAPVDMKAVIANATKVADEIKLDVGSHKQGLSTLHGMDYPEGLIGEMARFIRNGAGRSFDEVAVSTSLSIMAGICGRTFNVSNTGLNIYTMVMAGTGRGKESGRSGVDALMEAVKLVNRDAEQFIGAGRYASGQGLVRNLTDKPCALSVLGEFGLTLQQMTGPRASVAQQAVVSCLMDAFAKSGIGSTLRGAVYANKENDVADVSSPCLSLFCEGTPSTFYDALDISQLESGLLPRFMILEYKGKRLPRNKNPESKPNMELVKRLGHVVSRAVGIDMKNTAVDVRLDQGAELLMDAFDEKCDDKINDSASNAVAEMWNRAHLNALKVAALIAIGNNHLDPVISTSVATWSIEYVRRCIIGVIGKYDTGEIGGDDERRASALLDVMKQYHRLTNKQKVTYGVPKSFINTTNGIIPRTYLVRRLKMNKLFGTDRRGVRVSIKEAIALCEDMGEIKVFSPMQMNEIGQGRTEAYALIE